MPSVTPCAGDTCARFHAEIGRLCHDMGWPPDQPVLVAQPDGSTCACTCGGAARAAGGERPGPPGVGPCHDTACYLEPRMVEMCQEFPAGQAIILNEGSGAYCFCYCWGGALVPYTIANGEGEQVALDAIPVGGFVMAAGLELQWSRMLLRWASRPWQAAPQQAYQITVLGTTMQVPGTHMFLTAQKKLILARQMVSAIALMAPDGSPVAVEKIEAVSIHGSFQLVATADVDPGADLLWHLLNSQGVVSADYAVEKAYQQRRLPRRLLAFPYGT